MYYKGVYHLFYQYNPKGAVWGNIVWAHSISTDLINWFPLEHALAPSKPFDINGCWSGSATILPGNKPVILYTGIDPDERQVQNIAVPKNLSDPFLREWVKPDYNPIITPTIGVNASAFRDPTTAWWSKDGHWRLVVGSKRDKRGTAVLYRSKDFIHWTKAKHLLHSSATTGMWECPDFYPVSLDGKQGLDTSSVGDGIKHVLKVSLDLTRFEYYTLGQYFTSKERYVPDNTSADDSTGLRYDYGNFYASKSFFDPSKNRRILWGWANESDRTPDDQIAKGWAGVQGSRVEIEGITPAQADVEVTFRIPSLEHAEPFDPKWVDAERLCGEKDASVSGGIGPFGLLTLASSDLQEYTAVFFRIFKSNDKYKVLMCSGGIRSSLTRDKMYKPSYGGFVDVDLNNGKLSLRSLIDNSVIESFGAGGKTCILSRVYPTLAIGKNAHLYVFNNGTRAIKIGKLKAWTVNSPRIN
ncbi:hypothetical protein MKX01_023273 [Papaver californicum]|nr:hypothetical protein MKX01_023273 [Papaver californicum]